MFLLLDKSRTAQTVESSGRRHSAKKPRVAKALSHYVLSKAALIGAGLALSACLSSEQAEQVGGARTTPLSASPFFFATGSPDGRLGALSRPPSSGQVETETADDFLLAKTTVITQATIFGLLPAGTPLDNIMNVEVELYHIFPADSDVTRTSGPPTFSTSAVPTRVNSPSDVEIDTATRESAAGTLAISASVVSANFTVANTVVNDIRVRTHGEGASSGEEVELTITFTNPIVLPAGHYFFRPEVLLTSGDFLYLSGPRPIVAPAGTPFPTGVTDLQAWIRDANLAPDWLRIGTDIIDGAAPVPTFNMAFSLTGESVEAGTPGQPNCHGQTISALAHQFGGIDAAASALGFSSVQALQTEFTVFCE
jgi:hypothetical protein